MIHDPSEIALEIAHHQEQIEKHKRQIQKRERRIAELMCLDICDCEGNVIPFADWK